LSGKLLLSQEIMQFINVYGRSSKLSILKATANLIESNSRTVLTHLYLKPVKLFHLQL